MDKQIVTYPHYGIPTKRNELLTYVITDESQNNYAELKLPYKTKTKTP